MVKEFKDFLARGNMMDLAIAVILGTAFGRVITSLVNDVLMPPLGFLLGRVDFSSLFIDLSGAGYSSLALARAAGAPVIAYGIFVNTILDFLIIGLSIFLVIKQYNRLVLRKPFSQTSLQSAPQQIVQRTIEPTISESLLKEIRDLLREQAETVHSGKDRVA